MVANSKVVGIRFQKIGKLYHFDARNVPDLHAGDFAIVSTSRGRQMGQVIGVLDDPPRPPRGSWKLIERKASPTDLLRRKELMRKEIEAMVACRDYASQLKLDGLKIVRAEFSFDGSRLTFLYNTDEEGGVNLGSLRKKISGNYDDVNIDFRRIGPRDVAKIIGGMGACGLETRCCSQFLTEFSPISIKMAKSQGVSLDPSEITGMCGRLRCCLIFEYEQYIEARKVLPKRGKMVNTPMGKGKVIDTLPLKEAVIVRLEEEDGRYEFLKHEIEPWKEMEALRKKSEEPCDRHDGGGCDCGRKGKK